jgi:hypothetical protein
MSASQRHDTVPVGEMSIEKAGEKMKAFIKLGVIALCLLLALGACDLYTGINVGWTANVVSVSSSYATVNYTATNSGQYDLTGVNLQIGVYGTQFSGYISDWTSPGFSLAKGQTTSGSIVIDIFPYTMADGAKVLAVDMDKPS